MAGLVLAAMLLPGAGLRAEPSEGAQRSEANAHASSGTGVVEAKDEKQGSVTIGGALYSVVPATRILSKTGEAIPLKMVPVARVFRDDPRVDTEALVSFEATKTANGWVLEYLRAGAMLPQ
jgi:hypothetical protein